MKPRILVCVATAACLGLTLAVTTAEGHPSKWYWSVRFTENKLVTQDLCFTNGSCRDVVTADCRGLERNPGTGRKDWIWNRPQTIRLFRHLSCVYQFSNGAVWKSLFHVMGENGWTTTGDVLLRRAGTPVASPPPPAAPTARTYVGVGGSHWILRVIDRGKLIKLEDGSIWKIAAFNYVDAILWLPIDDITVLEGGLYGYRLLNEDDGELVDATFLGYG
jgi:hypothetical protein